jgi:hypothetical protein
MNRFSKAFCRVLIVSAISLAPMLYPATGADEHEAPQKDPHDVYLKVCFVVRSAREGLSLSAKILFCTFCVLL